MDIPLDEVLFFDCITTHPSTGAATDADSTPTFAVYEESTDTDIGIGGNLTKRTSLTGNYRGSFTASAANGFEVGKWYSIIGSATVNSVAGKAVIKNFRIVLAEAVAGAPKTDLTYILGTLLTETAGLIAAGFKKFFNVSTPTGTVNSLPDAVAGAAGGLFIAGSNAATTISGLTTGALSCTTITASGAVAFQSTFAVTTSTSLAALSCTTITASGAVAFQSTLAVTGTTTLTGAITASNASNNIVGIDVAKFAGTAYATAEAAIVDDIWDEVLTSGTHNVASSSGRRLRQLATLDSSVNDAAATTTSFVTALTTAVDDFYNDQLLAFTSGALAGQSKPILAYNGTTKTITLSEALTSAPANGDAFTIQAQHIHPVSQIASGIWQDTTAGDFTVASSIGKSVMNGVSLGTGLTINGYTGNTPQTGDVYAAVTGATVEPTTPPSSTASILNKILWMFSLGKNKRTQTSTTELVRNDADNATIGTATKSDDGVTYTRGKYV